MLTTIIRLSLNNRVLVLALAAILMLVGAYQATQLPVDVLPDLNRPRVVVMVECPGMAPEEIVAIVTTPIETYLNGATGVTALRSSTTAGLVVITAEFDWNMDAIRCRQIVDERLRLAVDQLPPNIVPRIAPMGSMMGQIMYLTIWDEKNELSPMEIRSLADWTVRRRILGSGGVSEVLVIGGDLKQYQVLARIDDMFRHSVTFDDMQAALEGSNRNVTGGFLTDQGPQEILVRSIGRIEELDELKNLVVKGDSTPPILLHQVADITAAAAPKVGSSGVYIKNPDGTTISRPGVVLIVEKQVGSDTREITERILRIGEEIQQSINAEYPNVRIAPLYQQRTFIDLAVANVEEALYLGAFLVMFTLFLFLMDVRTTLITVIAIPLSIFTTCLVFAWFGFSINTMTLGGLVLAVGELVDSAIVNIENIYRRLRENFRKALEERLPESTIIFRAAKEVCNANASALFTTTVVVFPIFFLEGMEGKMFTPLGIAYVVSLLASLTVSLTLTPVLAYLLLPKKAERHRDKETPAMKLVKWSAEKAIRVGLTFPKTVLTCAAAALIVAVFAFMSLQRDFMPPFNEGAPQVNVALTPGTSLKTSEAFSSRIAEQLLQIEGITAVVRRTGRAELDEHVMPVSLSEMMCTVDLKSGRNIIDIFADIDKVIAPENLSGAVAYYDQPLQHLIAHLQTGTRSKITIKIRAEDPMQLRRPAALIQQLISDIPDIGNPRIDPIQMDIPQIRFNLKRDELAIYGLVPEEVNATIETAMQGIVTTQILEGKRTIDVVLRASDNYRENLEALAQMPIQTPTGQLIPLSAVAEIDAHASGPSRIDHEAGQTQITIQMNPQTRGSVDVKNDIDRVLEPYMDELTAGGVYLEITGLFQSEQESTRRLVLLSMVSLACIFLVLYRQFGSVNITLQVMLAVPLALVGAVAAIVITGQDRSILGLIGMISLCGIVTRNGILIIDHYFYLVKNEGEAFTKEMIVRAGRNRAAPVLMTVMTTIFSLIPITLAPDMPGREILYPIATVIVGGLIASTLVEFFVRPALFWTFGRKTAARLIEREASVESVA
ncbi:MAG: efflux RND transporter permease subunit [Planctomycetaceae bacterium]|nr:efflux RND transporter permease subunit [Planctomycetaceae bacterium]